MENVEGNAFLPCHAFLVVFSRVFFSRQQTRQNLSIFMKQRETTSAFSRIVLVVLSVSLLSLFRGVIVLVFYNVEKEIFSELRAERLKGANLKPSKDTLSPKGFERYAFIRVSLEGFPVGDGVRLSPARHALPWISLGCKPRNNISNSNNHTGRYIYIFFSKNLAIFIKCLLPRGCFFVIPEPFENRNPLIPMIMG